MWHRNKKRYIFFFCRTGRDSSVGIATRYGLDDPWIESRRGRDFLLPSRPALGSTQPPIQWIPNAFPGGKTAGTWRWPPTPYSAEVKERVERYLSFLSGPLWLVIWRTLPFPVEGWSDWNRTRSVFSYSTEDLVVECPVNVAVIWCCMPGGCELIHSLDVRIRRNSCNSFAYYWAPSYTTLSSGICALCSYAIPKVGAATGHASILFGLFPECPVSNYCHIKL